MPEGHELHRLAQLHERRYVGAPVTVTSPQGRFAAEAELLTGSTMTSAEAHGKHLFHNYGPAGTVHVHLGLYGGFTEFELPESAPVGQVRMRLLGKTHGTDLRGPNRCEYLTSIEAEAIKTRLGPDPLRHDAQQELAWERISRSRRSVADLLLDQSVLAGVGNVYRAEVLFRSGVDPRTTGRELSVELWERIWADLVVLMSDGVRTGRIDTVAEEHSPEVTGRAPRQDRHGGEVYVYRRGGQPCLACTTPVEYAVLAGRKLYWCPTCQPVADV